MRGGRRFIDATRSNWDVVVVYSPMGDFPRKGECICSVAYRQCKSPPLTTAAVAAAVLNLQFMGPMCNFGFFLWNGSSTFIINKPIPLFKEHMSCSVTLSIGKSSTGISPTSRMVTGKWHNHLKTHTRLFSLALFQCPPQNSGLSPWLQP